MNERRGGRNGESKRPAPRKNRGDKREEREREGGEERKSEIGRRAGQIGREGDERVKLPRGNRGMRSGVGPFYVGWRCSWLFLDFKLLLMNYLLSSHLYPGIIATSSSSLILAKFLYSDRASQFPVVTKFVTKFNVPRTLHVNPVVNIRDAATICWRIPNER